MKTRHKSDSLEQRNAEGDMLERLNRKLRLSLRRESLKLNCGGQVELDGYDPDKRVLCEVYAHIGALKPGQVHKVASDILKMLLVEKDKGRGWRKIYCLASDVAARKPRGDSWLACAATRFGVEIEVVQLPERTRASIQNAQHRQTR